MTARVLVVDDIVANVKLLHARLMAEYFEVVTASNGPEALEICRQGLCDIVLLDVMMPGMDGYEVCRRLKAGAETSAIPIIMLTARGEEADRVRGLETGADDYVVKPYGVGELIARIRAVLRRTRPSTAEEILSYGDIEMDLAAHRVTRNERPIHLGPTEFRLLRFFAENPNRVLSRDDLINGLGKREPPIDERTVDVWVGRLRRAIKTAGGGNPLRTVRSMGYVFDLP